MPIRLTHNLPVVFIRQSAFEQNGLSRSAIDQRYTLTEDEFRMEGSLIAIGPLSSDELLTTFLDDLERSGLVYFEDYFELSGNWPEWLELHATMKRETR